MQSKLNRRLNRRLERLTEGPQRLLARVLTPAALLLAASTAQAGGGTINVEIDYMVTGTHSHMPTQQEIDRVVQMFACQGWTLNVDIDDAIPEIALMECANSGVGNFWTCDGPASYKAIKDQWFDNDGGGWHYCIFGHQYTHGNSPGSSGRANNNADFIVTLWNFSGGQPNGSAFDVAATFAHELGHNLGLSHIAPLSSGGGNYSPNYASVMSYQFQLRGIRSRLNCLNLTDDTSLFRDLDYSHGRMPALNESALSEMIGVGIRAIDFDCDGVLENSVQQDLSTDAPWCPENGTQGVLFDRNDWASIIDVPTTPMPLMPAQDWECITRMEAARSSSLLASAQAGGSNATPSWSCPDANLSVEGCSVANEMVWVDPGNQLAGVGTGLSPYQQFTTAVFASPVGSVLYLQPAVHPGAVGVVLSKPMTLAGPGGAVLGL